MTARLSASVRASALIRAAQQSGGSAMVLAKGDMTAGGLLILFLDKGTNPRFLEPGLGPDGEARLIPCGPSEIAEESEALSYWKRRRERDPDLWVIELDVPNGERLAAKICYAS